MPRGGQSKCQWQRRKCTREEPSWRTVGRSSNWRSRQGTREGGRDEGGVAWLTHRRTKRLSLWELIFSYTPNERGAPAAATPPCRAVCGVSIANPHNEKSVACARHDRLPRPLPRFHKTDTEGNHAPKDFMR